MQLTLVFSYVDLLMVNPQLPQKSYPGKSFIFIVDLCLKVAFSLGHVRPFFPGLKIVFQKGFIFFLRKTKSQLLLLLADISLLLKREKRLSNNHRGVEKIGSFYLKLLSDKLLLNPNHMDDFFEKFTF